MYRVQKILSMIGVLSRRECEKYIKQGVELMPVTGVEPSMRDSGEPYSATDFRNALGDPVNNRSELADFVGEENVDNILNILALNSVEETSTMAGGAVAGYAAPLGSGSDRPKKKRKNEYIDISLIDEVIELIMKRGITQ